MVTSRFLHDVPTLKRYVTVDYKQRFYQQNDAFAIQIVVVLFYVTRLIHTTEFLKQETLVKAITDAVL